jgi:hypothetical protein
MISIHGAVAAPLGASSLQGHAMLPLEQVQWTNVPQGGAALGSKAAPPAPAPRTVAPRANSGGNPGPRVNGGGGQRAYGGGGGGQPYVGGGERRYEEGRRGGVDPGAALAVGVIGGIIGAAAEQQAEERARREYEAERRYERRRYYRD